MARPFPLLSALFAAAVLAASAGAQEAQLCEEAQYRAEQRAGEVTIQAAGAVRTSGYKVYFSELPIAVFPPEFALHCDRPSSFVLMVITPFEAEIAFKAGEPVEQVTVHDARGKHQVPVTQVE